jgi:radical SAM protein with 4Fe4S-binding SPASM domain
VHEFARAHDLVLQLTTNVQALTPARLADALDVIDHLILSIDSHDPDLLERIRPGARGAVVLDNARAAARLAAGRGTMVSANVVLLAQNLDTAHHTVAWLADIGVRDVTVVKMVNVNGRSARHDPFEVCSPEEIALARKRCEEAAQQGGIDLWWTAEGPIPIRPAADGRRDLAHALHEEYDRIALRNPGFCRFAHSGIRVGVDGDVTPCGYAGQGELTFGSLASQSFEEVWNGASARDLRRAMYTRDLPSLCATCQHALDPDPDGPLPFEADLPPVDDPTTGAPRVEGPRVLRSGPAPTITVHGVPAWCGDLELVLSLGGEGPAERTEAAFEVVDTGTIRFAVDDTAWQRLAPNQGYWWNLLGRPGPDGPERRLLARSACLVRATAIARVPGSALRYQRPAEVAVHLGAQVEVRRA